MYVGGKMKTLWSYGPVSIVVRNPRARAGKPVVFEASCGALRPLYFESGTEAYEWLTVGKYLTLAFESLAL